jgi:hypothetical protein
LLWKLITKILPWRWRQHFPPDIRFLKI